MALKHYFVDQQPKQIQVCEMCDTNYSTQTIQDINVCQSCYEQILHPYKTKKQLFEFSTSKCEIDQISDYIFLGNQLAARDQQLLKSKTIKNVLVCGGELEKLFPNEFNYFQINIEDNEQTNILEYLDESIEFIRKAVNGKQNVLVHCAAGQSRSVAILIGYFIKVELKSFDDALRFIFEKKRKVRPNQRFINDLKIYQQNFF